MWKDFGTVVKKLLNIEEFKNLTDIIIYLNENLVAGEELSVNKTIILEENNEIQLFVMFGKTEVFVVKDDGFKIRIIFRVNKLDFKYHIIKENDKPRLYIEDTVTTLPINTNYSGSTSIVEYKINSFLKND